MRKPLVAGSFYEEEKEILIKHLNGLSEQAKERGKIVSGKNAVGAIVPHAGYMFSGLAAAEAFDVIAKSGCSTFVILGVNHTGIGGNSTTNEDFQTPLGIAKIDTELSMLLKKECRLEMNEEAHKYEHSIEVMLPFLQHKSKQFTFVPIIVSEEPIALGENLAKAIEAFEKKTKRKVFVIASSDMTHFGASYGYVPFGENIKANLYSLDKGAIDLALKNDAAGFLDYVEDHQATICGRNTIASLITYAKLVGAKGKLIDYYTSGDIVGDYRSAVGYASIIFFNP